MIIPSSSPSHPFSMKPYWLSSVCVAVLTAGCGLSGRGNDSGSQDTAKPVDPGTSNAPAATVAVPSTNATSPKTTATVTAEVVAIPPRADIAPTTVVTSAVSVATATIATPQPVVRAPIPPPELPPVIQEVVRLAQTSVGDEVVVTYIETSPEIPRLNVDQIIHLRDLGISMPVIQALLKRDPSGNVAASSALAVIGTNAPQQTVIIQAGTQPPGGGAGLAPQESSSSAATVPGSGNVILTNYLAATAGGPPTGTPTVANAPVAPAAPIYGPGPTAVQAPQAVAAPVQAVAVPSTASFHESLSPYGTWVQVENYGWCWQPSVAVVNTSWRPYCDDGHWLWTDNGWYWNSNYSWGWAPFHYGRWHRNASFGWVWYPGTVWGPAWVTWRYSDTYCGWAPLPPEAVWDVRLGLCHGGSRVSINFGWGLGLDYFSCVPFDRFYRRDVWRYCAPRDRNVTIINNTTVVNNYIQNNNTVINGGLDKGLVERRSRSEVRKVAIQDAGQPSEASRLVQQGDRPVAVNAYRPKISGQSAVPPASILARQEAQKLAPVPAIASRSSAITGRPNVSSGIADNLPKRAEPSSRSSGARPAVQPTGDALRRELTGKPATGVGGDMRALGGTSPAVGSRSELSRPTPIRPGAQVPSISGPTYARPQYQSPQASPAIPPSRATPYSNPGVPRPQPDVSGGSPRISPRAEIPKIDASQSPRSSFAGGGARAESGASPLFRPGVAGPSGDMTAVRPMPAPVPAARTDVSRAPTRYESAPAPRVYSAPAPSASSAVAPRGNSEAPRPAPSYSAPPQQQQQRSSVPTPNYSPTPRGGPSYTPSAAPQSRSAPIPSYTPPARSESSGGGGNSRPGRSAREQ